MKLYLLVLFERDSRTCGCHLVQGPVGLVRRVTRDVVTKSNSSQRHKAVVQWVQVIPLRLQRSKYGCRHKHNEGDVARDYDKQMQHPDVEGLTTKQFKDYNKLS